MDITLFLNQKVHKHTSAGMAALTTFKGFASLFFKKVWNHCEEQPDIVCSQAGEREEASEQVAAGGRFLLKWNMPGKIPTPIKKNWHFHPPPLPEKPTTPPLERGVLWAWGYSSRKSPKMPGAHKSGAAISGPRIAGRKITDISFVFFFLIFLLAKISLLFCAIFLLFQVL